MVTTYGYALKVNGAIRLPVAETKEGAVEAHKGIARWLIEEDGGSVSVEIVRVAVTECSG